MSNFFKEMTIRNLLVEHKGDNKTITEKILAMIDKTEKAAYEKGFQCGREAGKAEQKQIESISRKWYIG